MSVPVTASAVAETAEPAEPATTWWWAAGLLETLEMEGLIGQINQLLQEHWSELGYGSTVETSAFHSDITRRVREAISNLVVPLLAADDHSVKFFTAQQRDALVDQVMQALNLMPTHEGDVRSVVQQTTVAYQNMLRAVHRDDPYRAVRIINQALRRVSAETGKTLKQVISRHDTRTQVYGVIFVRRGLVRWQHKAALMAARTTGLTPSKLLQVMVDEWGNDDQHTITKLRDLHQKPLEQIQIDIVLAIKRAFESRASQIFRPAA